MEVGWPFLETTEIIQPWYWDLIQQIIFPGPSEIDLLCFVLLLTTGEPRYNEIRGTRTILFVLSDILLYQLSTHNTKQRQLFHLNPRKKVCYIRYFVTSDLFIQWKLDIKRPEKSPDMRNNFVWSQCFVLYCFFTTVILNKKYLIQWNLVITRTLGPWKVPCYNRFLYQGKKTKKYKELGPFKWPYYKRLLLYPTSL